MHITEQSIVTIREGQPWGGLSGIVESIRVFFDLGPSPITYLDVHLENGIVIPFALEQIQRHIPKFSKSSPQRAAQPVEARVIDPEEVF